MLDDGHQASPCVPQGTRLVVATVLPRVGCCGVQTHFRTLSEYARRRGVAVAIVSPYDASLWVRRPVAAVSRLVRPVSSELAELWNKAAFKRQLKARLRAELREPTQCATTVYAQDPLSAEAALEVRSEDGRQLRIATVVHFNGSEADEHAANGKARRDGMVWASLMRRERCVLPSVDAIIYVSEYTRSIVEARVPAARKVVSTVLPNFVGASPERTRLPSERPIRDLISIGTLEPRKNQAYLLEVLAAAKATGHRYTLSLAGDGPSRREYERRANELGISDQVSFLGYVQGANALMASHRVLVHAARHETFGIVLVEAMQQGIPVIAAAVGGIPEVFEAGVEGLFWPLDDAPAAARVLVELLESERKCAQMGAAGRRRYERCFSANAVGPRWMGAILGDCPPMAGGADAASVITPQPESPVGQQAGHHPRTRR